MYSYPTRKDGRADSETPVDENNQALAALRYLVATLDAAFLAKFRHAAASGGCEPPDITPSPDHAISGLTPPARRQTQPWLRLDNEHLWS
jgi:hypothetical protein